MTKAQAILVRFLKGFVAAGVAQVAVALASGLTIHTISDIQNLGITVGMAFLTGGLLGIEKLLSWQAPQVPTPPASTSGLES